MPSPSSNSHHSSNSGDFLSGPQHSFPAHSSHTKPSLDTAHSLNPHNPPNDIRHQLSSANCSPVPSGAIDPAAEAAPVHNGRHGKHHYVPETSVSYSQVPFSFGLAIATHEVLFQHGNKAHIDLYYKYIQKDTEAHIWKTAYNTLLNSVTMRAPGYGSANIDLSRPSLMAGMPPINMSWNKQDVCDDSSEDDMAMAYEEASEAANAPQGQCGSSKVNTAGASQTPE